MYPICNDLYKILSEWVTVELDIKAVTDQCKLSWILHNTVHCIEGTQSIQDGQIGWTHISILNGFIECSQNYKMAVCLSEWTRKYNTCNLQGHCSNTIVQLTFAALVQSTDEAFQAATSSSPVPFARWYWVAATSTILLARCRYASRSKCGSENCSGVCAAQEVCLG